MARTMHISFPSMAGVLLILAGCAGKTPEKPAEPVVTATELRAFCPPVLFFDDTAYYNVYAPGAEGDAGRVNYQAVISDVTRTCQYPDDKLVLNIRAAGRVVPGSDLRTQSVTLPIHVRVVQGVSDIYNKTYPYKVSLKGNAAEQFIFSADMISLPKPQVRNVKVYVGFDVKRK